MGNASLFRSISRQNKKSRGYQKPADTQKPGGYTGIQQICESQPIQKRKKRANVKKTGNMQKPAKHKRKNPADTQQVSAGFLIWSATAHPEFAGNGKRTKYSLPLGKEERKPKQHRQKVSIHPGRQGRRSIRREIAGKVNAQGEFKKGGYSHGGESPFADIQKQEKEDKANFMAK